MPVIVRTITDLIEKMAPRPIAEKWDHVGLQTGSLTQPVRKIFLSLDLTEEVLHEAITAKADMLVVHHSPFFRPLQAIRTDQAEGRLIADLIKSGMALYTAHTNLDAARGGVNDVLAELFGLSRTRPLIAASGYKLYKLAVYIPDGYLGKVHESISQAGAGWIGNYSDCSFQVKGTGTFRPLPGAKPFIGRQGQLERVDETRLETIVPEEALEKVLAAMKQAHPYEEVAYDLYPLSNEDPGTGTGRVGTLPEPIDLKAFIARVKETLQVKELRYVGDQEKVIKKVALCGGSGADFLNQAVAVGADVYVTADLKYHDGHNALAQNMALVDPGHYALEFPVIPALTRYLQRMLAAYEVDIEFTRLSTDPFQMI